MGPRELAEQIRSDVSSGASAVVRRAADAYRSVLDDGHAPHELRPALIELTHALLEAQPAMAPLFSLGCAVVGAAVEAEPHGVGDAARRALDEFVQRLETAEREISSRAEGLVPAGGRVLTVSTSGTVRSVLINAATRKRFDVVCLEGRPNFEGRSLAAALAEAGLDVTIAVDAAVSALLRDCDLVLVGADSIGDLGVVNKIGTRTTALAARRYGVPAYALTDTTKFLPVGQQQRLDGGRAPSEVWDSPAPGVTVWNQYYEATPLAFFDGVVTELGLHTEADVDAMRASIPVPAPLR